MGLLADPEGGTRAPDFAAIAIKLAGLERAMTNGSSRVSCLRRWSEFVRERDDHRCVNCHSRTRLSAHHIARKSFLVCAQFQTGNGITLCRDCHSEAHQGFNRRPDLSQPVDAEGGEKLHLMERLYSFLIEDAVERGIALEEFYFLSDEVLQSLKKMQGYESTATFPGSRLEQAHLILAEAEWCVRSTIAEANGFSVPRGPLLPGVIFMTFEDDGSQTVKPLVPQNYRPRSPGR